MIYDRETDIKMMGLNYACFAYRCDIDLGWLKYLHSIEPRKSVARELGELVAYLESFRECVRSHEHHYDNYREFWHLGPFLKRQIPTPSGPVRDLIFTTWELSFGLWDNDILTYLDNYERRSDVKSIITEMHAQKSMINAQSVSLNRHYKDRRDGRVIGSKHQPDYNFFITAVSDDYLKRDWTK